MKGEEGEIMPMPAIMKATRSPLRADSRRPDIDSSSRSSRFPVGLYLIRSSSGSTGSEPVPLCPTVASHYRWKTSSTKGRRPKAAHCPPTTQT